MSDAAARFRAFLTDAPHWIDLLSDVPAQHVLRHDTAHPVFHGCIDWHSACHGVWALIAHRGTTHEARHAGIVDRLLMPDQLALEASDLKSRPDFEMPYGRAWFLRLALEDRRVTGSTRLTFIARDVALSLIDYYRGHPPEPFVREYANASWALINLLDYGLVENRGDAADFARQEARRLAGALDHLPGAEEAQWPDFMAVVPSFCELLVRAGAVEVPSVLEKAGKNILALRPVETPTRPHHHALNFSRAWSLFALFDASDDEQVLALALDHLETGLSHPSWWRGDYRAVAHWVPQFGIFALQRAIEVGNRRGVVR